MSYFLRLLEKLSVPLAVILAAAVISGGTFLAVNRNHFDWLNRAGALVVCLEGLIVLAEASRRIRIERFNSSAGQENPYVAEEFQRSEYRLTKFAVCLAILGEFLHGFGDVLLNTISQ